MRDPTILFEGREIPAAPGDSIAAALTAAGETRLGSRFNGAGRGVFCGMGVCHDCLVTVDGQRGQRACMTKARPGMIVTREDDRSPADAPVVPRAHAPETLDTEILIVGAGPAGLTAAIRCAEAGADVIALDERDDPGGQYFKPRSAGYRAPGRLDRQHRRGDDLRARAVASGARLVTGQGVWFARKTEQKFELRSLGESGGLILRARTVILASGAYERPAMVPGWTLPGVMTIGAAQTLSRRYGVVPGKRILIAGHGPLGLQLAADLAAHGADVVALAERGRLQPTRALASLAWSGPRLFAEGLGYRFGTFRAGVPMFRGWELSAVLGAEQVEGAELREIATGQTRRFSLDSVVAGDGFAPQLELARLLGVPVETDAARGAIRPERNSEGRTRVNGVWIAGDAGGLGGAEVALSQGALSADGALRFIGRTSSPNVSQVRKRLYRAHRFQRALWSAYAAPERDLPSGDTILCRCESVTATQALEAIDAGAQDPAVLKRQTRIGMGRCQGRYCLPQVMRMFAASGQTIAPEALFAPQIPTRPVALGALALEKPEWGGHRESAPSIRPGRPLARPLAVRSADLVVIGGGVTGIAAAMYAARAGASVVCLDRGRVNGEASGGNAGSLHLQLLSWDFGGKAVGDGDLQLRTLPLQKESIKLWTQLETELGADFEMAVTGGLMVAEKPEHIAFLEAKAEAEARVGIRTDVIGAEDVRRIIPAISDRIIGAAWCPGEGKINPLAATPPLARAARAAGAVIEEFAPVTAIQRDGDGYMIDTPRGRIATRRILIASGGWSDQIARLLGARLPIRGAPLQMVVTAPGPDLVPCLVAHADRHLTMKQTASGSVIIGGAWPAVTDPTGQATVLPESLEGNLWVAAHTVPQLGGFQVIRSWAAMNIDIDGAPLIGPVPGLDGVSVAATANGYTLGPLMGREAAAAALSGRLRQDLEAFSMARFTQAGAEVA